MKTIPARVLECGTWKNTQPPRHSAPSPFPVRLWQRVNMKKTSRGEPHSPQIKHKGSGVLPAHFTPKNTIHCAISRNGSKRHFTPAFATDPPQADRTGSGSTGVLRLCVEQLPSLLWFPLFRGADARGRRCARLVCVLPLAELCYVSIAILSARRRPAVLHRASAAHPQPSIQHDHVRLDPREPPRRRVGYEAHAPPARCPLRIPVIHDLG